MKRVYLKTYLSNALIILGLWSFPLTMLAWQKHQATLANGQESQWFQHFLGNLPYALLWSVFTPIIWLLARRVSFGGKRFLTPLLFHVPAGFLITLIHDMGVRMIMFALHPNPSGPLVLFSQRWFSNWLKNPWPEEYAFVLVLASFILFRERARDSELREWELQTSLLTSQMAGLKMHLQPHFLFNTLQTINSFAFRKDTQMVSKLLEQLGQLLRSVLDAEGRPWVYLGQELEFLNQYLAFEKLRFQDRLSLELDIDPETKQAYIPHLILQPLVENALKHGINQKIDGGTLKIRTRRDQNSLIIQVQDSGPGIKEPRGQGIGLAHTQTRLALLFPNNHQFQLKPVEGGGTEAFLVLPFLEEEP